MMKDEFSKRIAHEQAAGWRVKDRGDDWALLHKPNFGTKDGHVLIAVLTVWWAFGLANAAYALFKYWYDTPTKLLEADDPIETESSPVSSAKTEPSRAPSSRSPTVDPSAATDADRDPLSILRERYARGEIDEAEFERRVERLLETDSIEAAKRRHERRREREPTVERS